MADGHDGAHGGAANHDMGNPGSHQTGELGNAEHGHGPGHANHGGDFDHDYGKGIHHDKGGHHHGAEHSHGGSLIFAHSHHSWSHHKHGRYDFSNPAPNDADTPHGATARESAVDPITETVTREQARIQGCRATSSWTVYEVNHGEFDHKAAIRRYAAEISDRFFDLTKPSAVHGKGAWRQTKAYAVRKWNWLIGNKKALIPIHKRVPAKDGIDKTEKTLLSYHALNENPSPKNMPDGWLPGFTGQTRLLKELWQLAPFSRRTGQYEYDRMANTELEIFVVCWRFNETGCYTSRITVRVHSRPVYDPLEARYGRNRDSFDEHQLVGQWVTKRFLDDLLRARPGKLEQEMLNKYKGKMPKPTHDEGFYPTPEDVDHELDDINAEEARTTDSDPRRTGGAATGYPGGVGYLDSPGGVGSGVDPNPDGEEGGDAPAAGVVPMGITSGSDLGNVFPGMVAQSGVKRKRPEGAVPVKHPPAPEPTKKVTITLPKK